MAATIWYCLLMMTKGSGIRSIISLQCGASNFLWIINKYPSYIWMDSPPWRTLFVGLRPFSCHKRFYNHSAATSVNWCLARHHSYPVYLAFLRSMAQHVIFLSCMPYIFIFFQIYRWFTQKLSLWPALLFHWPCQFNYLLLKVPYSRTIINTSAEPGFSLSHTVAEKPDCD